MKFLTAALFLGVINAEEYDQELAEMLKISVSPAGEKAIEKEGHDVEVVAHRIKGSQPVRNLEASLKRWLKTKQMHDLHKLDVAFWKSPEGQRLKKEWMDVGNVLKAHLKKDKNGLHFDNKQMNNLSDEMDDVADQYQALDGGKWDKAFDKAWAAAFKTKQFASLKRRLHSFKGSNEGKALHKEVVDLKKAIKTHLKVTDIPKSWKKDMKDSESSSSSDDEDLEELLKITVSPAGQKVIEKEAKDVGHVAHKIKDTAPVRNLHASLKRWAHSKEMNHLKKLDQAFLASPEGKRLMKEWHDFGVALKKSIKKTKNGVHIDNKAINNISDEADDVADQYDALDGSKWDKAYTDGWKAATHNKQFGSLKRRMHSFKTSAEGKALKKEMVELKHAIHKNLKVTDIPKSWQKEDSSSSDEEEELSVAPKKKVQKKKVAKKAKKEDSSSSEEEELSVAPKKKVQKKKVAKKAKKEESSSSDDEEVEEMLNLIKKAKKGKRGGKVFEEESEEDSDLEELLKITISKAGQKAIAKEWTDVEKVWDAIDDSQVVRNTEASAKRWAHSKEMKDLEALDKKFLATPRGKKMKAEIEDVFRQLDKSVYHNKQGMHIDNEDLQHVDDELTDVVGEMKSFKKSKWNNMYNQQMQKTFNNKQAQSLHRRLVAFKNSKEGKALGKELKDFKMALKKNVKVTDLPQAMEEEDDLYLF